RRDVVHRDVGQHLAVDRDVRLLEAVHQAAVGQAELARTGVDADDPQRAELALALLAADVRVLVGLRDGLLRDAEYLAAGVVVALRLGDDFLVAAARGDAFLDSCHGSVLPQRYGSMRATRPASSARTWFVPRRLRLRLVDFLVRMWLLKAWPHLNL